MINKLEQTLHLDKNVIRMNIKIRIELLETQAQWIKIQIIELKDSESNLLLVK